MGSAIVPRRFHDRGPLSALASAAPGGDPAAMLAALIQAGAPSPGVDLQTQLGPFPARMSLCDHGVWAVQAGPFSGQDALFRLLVLPRRPIAQRARTAPPTGPSLGEGQALLAGFEAFRTELMRAASHVGGSDRVWTIRFAALKTILDGLPEDVKRVVRLCDGTRDVLRLAAEGPLPPLVTLKVLDKLLSAGVLVRADLDDELVSTIPTTDDDDGGRGPDRRWQRSRTSPPMAGIGTLPPTATTTTPTPSTVPTATTTAAPAPTTTTVTAPTMPAPTTPAPSETMPAPRAVTTTEPAPVILEQRRLRAANDEALPRPAPKPRAELHAWLGDEEAFFESHAPPPSRWHVWQLAALLVLGSAIGVVLARACG